MFTTAWRRIDDIPDGDAERPWLFGVAYRTLANHARSRRRRVRLVDELAVALRRFEQQPTGTVVDSEALETALGRLSDIDRAIVTLTAWEQFNSAEIGAILDLSPGTVRTGPGPACAPQSNPTRSATRPPHREGVATWTRPAAAG
ncbi:RNA polymerase sigma factor [Cryptosporangium sp. NPDC048952]|uniref:RNA polymerase sigma factor n=1 Tax=Cryptosporangium sp. NPDC048952 TaxID=3363961 RepID=UPI00371AB1FC